MRFFVGAQVTLLGPYDTLPIILSMQRYARVAEICLNGDVIIQLSDTMPPNQRFGPFHPSVLAKGWRDDQGQWR